jgi:hypothetical protein
MPRMRNHISDATAGSVPTEMQGDPPRYASNSRQDLQNSVYRTFAFTLLSYLSAVAEALEALQSNGGPLYEVPPPLPSFGAPSYVRSTEVGKYVIGVRC